MTAATDADDGPALARLICARCPELSASEVEALTGRMASAEVLKAIIALVELQEVRINQIEQKLQS